MSLGSAAGLNPPFPYYPPLGGGATTRAPRSGLEAPGDIPRTTRAGPRVELAVPEPSGTVVDFPPSGGAVPVLMRHCDTAAIQVALKVRVNRSP